MKLDPSRMYTPADLELVDDGTMDTVVRLPNGEEWRYGEYAANWRDESGALDFTAFIEDVVLGDMDADPELWEE